MSEENSLERRRAQMAEIAKSTGGAFSPEQIGVIQKQVAKDTTLPELAHFLNVCKSTGLNPFNREVWCYKDHKGNLVMFTGRDGYLKKAQENPAFNGIRSAAVYSKDEFEANIPEGKIHHRFNNFEDRGELVGAYAIVYRKEGEATIETAKLSQYKPKTPNHFSPWSKTPSAMICKVAESHALKKAFGIAGLQSEYDFTIQKGKAVAKEEYVDAEEVNEEYERMREFVLQGHQIPAEMLAKYPDLETLKPNEDDND